MIKELCLLLSCWLIVLNVSFASQNNVKIHIEGMTISLLDQSDLDLDQKVTENRDTLRIPLTRAGNLFFIEAQIDSVLGNFLVDLGAPYLVLNSTYFRATEIDAGYTAGTLNSQTDYVLRTTIKNLDVFGIQYSNLSADLTDLGAIENRRGIKILGLLGLSLFNDFVFDLDVKNQQLLLYRSIKTSVYKPNFLLSIPIKIQNQVLLVKAEAKNVSLNLSIDSGAERNILDNTLSSIVYEDMNILGNSIITDGNGGRSEAILIEYSHLKMADVSLQKMKTLILNLDIMSRAYGKQIDGMLGYPFFALGRVVIDFKKKKLMLYQSKRKANG
jgi:predicted aspartyl protease